MSSTAKKKEFKESVLPFMDDLERVAKHLCHNDFDADDLLSETVLKAFEKFSQLQQASSAKSWLLRIMHNTFVDQFRRKKKFTSIDFTETLSNEDGEFSLHSEVAAQLNSSDDPEALFLNSLLREDIEVALMRLPDDFRVVVILNDVEGLPYNEIASILNIPVGTVRSRISRGKKLMQKFLFLHAAERGIVSSDKKGGRKICTCGKEDGEPLPLRTRHKSSIRQ